MAANVLQEYLVSLGFRLDEDGWKKFSFGVERARAAAVGLGTGMVATATAVSVGVEKIAQQFTDLYYVAQRARSSVAELKTFEYAGKQVGLTYDQARGSVESFAASLRMNPGLQGLLKGMGVDPSNAATASTAFVGKLKQQFGEGGYFVAARVAQMYGVEEATFRQLWTNFERLTAQQAEYARRLKESGLDADAMAKKSVAFTRALDSLGATFDIVGAQAADKMLPWMTSAVGWLDKLAGGISQVNKNTDGWSSSLIALGGAVGGLKAVAWVLSFIPGLGGVAAAMGAPAAAAAIGARAVGGPLGILLGSTSELNSGEKDIYDKNGRMTEYGRQVTGQNPKGNRAGAAIDYFVKQGWSREAATGIAAGFQRESNLDPTAFNPKGGGRGAIGIGQWRGPRQDHFRAIFGKDLKDATFEEQLAFKNWELNNTERATGSALRGARTAAEAGEIDSRLSARHGNTAEDARRGALAQSMFNAGPLGGSPSAGGANVTITQKNEIRISGAADAGATEGAVVGALDRANGDLVRNTKGALR